MRYAVEPYFPLGEPDVRGTREHYWAANPRRAAGQEEKNVAFNDRGHEAGYSSYWIGLAVLGILTAAVGFVAGMVDPGPWTGVLFPIGITILAVVAVSARSRVRLSA